MNKLKCDWCGKTKKKMTIWYNVVNKTGYLLFLCFRGCQHFPEPFIKVSAELKVDAFSWTRIDPFQKKRKQPRLSKHIQPIPQEWRAF